MQITGTKEAFLALVSQRGFAGKSGLDKTLVSLWSSGKRVPTLDKMEEVLVKFGGCVVHDKIWEVFTMEDMIKKIAADAEKVLKDSNKNTFLGVIHVHPFVDYNNLSDFIDIDGTQYEINCSLENSHPFILKTVLKSGQLPGLIYTSTYADPLEFELWIAKLKEEIQRNIY